MKIKKTKTITFPAFFILDDLNRTTTIKYLNSITRYSGRIIFLDFSKIQNINKSVVLILLAQIEKTIGERRNSIFRKHGFPKRKSIRKLLTEVTEVVHHKQSSNFKLVKHNEKNNLLDTVFINYATNLTHKIGIKEYQHDLYIIIQEIMANAVEHGVKRKNINWWMTHEVNNKLGKLTYTFLDMGDGISQSYKKSGLPLKYRFKDNRHIIIDALYGSLGSSTGKPERGNGLPQIKNFIELEYIKDFHLITNTVSLCYKNDEFIIDKNPNFYGTFFTWTINKDNI